MLSEGIINQNDFYSSHYLSDVFESDVKAQLQEWTRRAKEEADFRAPFDALGGLRKEFFEMQGRRETARSAAEALEIQASFVEVLIRTLGYDIRREILYAGDHAVPVLAALRRSSGAPLLWVIEVGGVDGDGGANPLDLEFDDTQYPDDIPPEHRCTGKTLEEAVGGVVFRMDEPPRWLLLASADMLLLVDRSKWNEKRLLGFDLRDILDRRDAATLRAVAVLLHKECIAPEAGSSALLDTLDERSHRHAYAVSEDLKFSMREAVELLGNEAVWYLREVAREKVYGGAVPAPRLSAECLRYIYRLLFLFYIESRPELGYAPMNAEAYRTGYSLESLRDLELLPLESEEARDGFFLHHSIERLFGLVFEGFGVLTQADTEARHDAFAMPPLKSHLFDPARTPILRRVRFRNAVVQRVIRLMSLSREKRGKRPGRIGYAQLGINQLGAVYEGLLSYTGFFAEEDMYEVKKKGSSPTALERAFFVTLGELKDYEEDEKVLGDDGRVRKYEKGSFIYRLTGRSRETSASYYTPEVLTSCLVKYALKELFEGKGSDEILRMKVCEPAMGSAAFLNEYVNQAADVYLRRKQKETGTVIPHDRYVEEKQKVKAWLADNTVYGVDLNPVAVELAEVSLWLNTMHRESIVPWFGNQLVCGNSLVGARRQYFRAGQLGKLKDAGLWLDAVPQRVKPGTVRPEDGVYHFLLPDRGMAEYADKVVKAMVPGEIKAIKEWKRAFTAPFTRQEQDALLRLSSTIDGLWEEHLRQRRHIEEQTEDATDIYGYPSFGELRQRHTTQEKDTILRRELYGDGRRNAGPYQRLKLVMDYWCALWYWPIDRAAALPNRGQFIDDCVLILEGKKQTAVAEPQGDLFPPSVPEEARLELFERYGIVDVRELRKQHPRLSVVHQISESQHFLHWELEFAEIFADRGGFDLVLGNPPWIKIEWNEGAVLGDADPKFMLRSMSASDLTKEREKTLETYGLRVRYLEEFSAAEATQNFLNALQNYPLLKGMQTNLYKCFLPQSWMVLHDHGVAGFLHPEGVYDDPKGGKLRVALYPRLRKHFQFQNEMGLFPIANRATYSINVYGEHANESELIEFETISNLFHPRTIDLCYGHDGKGDAPGIKDDSNNWSIIGHSERIIHVSEELLHVFRDILEDQAVSANEARLLNLHNRNLTTILEKVIRYELKIHDYNDVMCSTSFWDEANGQKDGTIVRNVTFPVNHEALIYSGPHFYVNNPFHQTPRDNCHTHRDYDHIDLIALELNYLPRTNYTPNCSQNKYQERTPSVSWSDTRKITDEYRLVHRRLLSIAGERTAVSAIIPPGPAHIHTVISTACKDEKVLLLFAGVMSTLILDYYVKTTGRNDLYLSNLQSVPMPTQPNTRAILISRILRLNCLTTHYADLWERNWESSYEALESTEIRASLPYSNLGPKWKPEYALRAEYDRRQAQLEIDVALAKELGITMAELNTIYRIQFPVLRQYEQDTWYDQNGRIVFTISKGLPGVGLDRKTWEEVKSMQSGTVEKTFEDDTMPGGPVTRAITYIPPWTRCDREEDYRRIWEMIVRIC